MGFSEHLTRNPSRRSFESTKTMSEVSHCLSVCLVHIKANSGSKALGMGDSGQLGLTSESFLGAMI